MFVGLFRFFVGGWLLLFFYGFFCLFVCLIDVFQTVRHPIMDFKKWNVS